jgi:hypothetical protein
MPGDGALTGDTATMTGLKIGYPRVLTDAQDLTAQREAPAALGVDPQRIHVDHRLTGTNRARPRLVCARRWLPAGPETRWWSPSSTGSPAR